MFKRLAAVCLAGAMLTGCTGLNIGVDTLLAAPKLTEEQSQIHQALINAVGNNLTLKYPKNGSYRSAYVIADIDDEPTDEAIVFYEYTGADAAEDGLRVNLLDKDEDGKWYSVKEIAGAGTEVDKVILTRMGAGNRMNVLVGYQTLSGDEKALEIYSYRNDDLVRVGTSSYSVLEPLDINGDGSNELVAIRKITNSETGQVTSKASLLEMNSDEVSLSQSTDMCENIVSYAKARSGRLADGRRAIFVDAVNSDGMLHTEIVYYRYSALQNPMQLRSEKLLPLCTRQPGYYSADVDGDGVIEIPMTTPMLGYENAITEEEPMLLTTWKQYKDFYELEDKYSGYYAVSDGYAMMFPSRWADQVTVKKDSSTGEAVFYKYGGDINAEMTELMRIAVAAKQQSQAYTYDGYEVITSMGQLDYLVKLPTNKRESLILTIDEVVNNFYVIEG
ncbi:MAG: hypothetical protein IJ561_04960 [Ruminococcus sp.]|nr:hypothetical protein [Ruminococcus sp.]